MKLKVSYVLDIDGASEAYVSEEVYINDLNDTWQYIMGSIEIKHSAQQIKNIKFDVIYHGANKVYIDGAQLYKETMYTNFLYNENGNVDKIYINSNNILNIQYDDVNENKITHISSSNGEIISEEFNENKYIYNSNDTLDKIIINNVTTSYIYDFNDPNVLLETNVTLTNGKYYNEKVSYNFLNQYLYQKTDKYGSTTTFNYNSSNGLLSSIQLPNGSTKMYDYGNASLLNSTYVDNQLAKSVYTYDSYKKLKTVDVNGLIYEIIYNDIGQVEKIVLAGMSLIETDYVEKMTNNGNLYYTNLVSSEKYANGNTYVFKYDSNDLLYQVFYKVTPTSQEVLLYEYSYDSMGRLIIYSDIVENIKYYYSYNNYGKISNIIDSKGDSKEYKYDDYGQLKSYNYEIGNISREISYVYDYENRIYDYTSYKINTTNIKSDFFYDSENINRLVKNTISKNDDTLIDIIYGYDVSGNPNLLTTRPTSIRYYVEYETYCVIYDFYYKYDNMGNIIDESIYFTTDYEINVLVSSKSYKYDELNQLIREDNKYSLGGQNISFTYTYGYDANGNRNVKNTYKYTDPNIEPITSDLIDSKVYSYDQSRKDQLKTYDGNTYTYDAQGNLINVGDKDWGVFLYLTYEGRQLVSYYSDITTNLVTYKYNDQGYRISKNVNGVIHTYELDGDKVLVEKYGNNVLYYAYGHDGKLISVNINGNEYFYQRNILNDIVGLYDINGNLVVQYAYDAFGNIIYQTNLEIARLNPYRYRGYRYDEETKLYYLNSRYYDASIGRFINADGYIGEVGSTLSHNMYTYALNNPITYYYPTGYISVFTEIAIGIAVDVALGVILGFISGGASFILGTLTDIISEAASTIIINLLNKVSWDLNIGKNVVSALVAGGALAIVGGLLVKLATKFNIGSQIDNIFGKLFNKVDDVTEKVVKEGSEDVLAKGSNSLSKIDDYVDLTEHRKTHILNRHSAGAGKHGKTEFPSSWSDDRILHNISDVATDPKSITGIGKYNSPYSIGIRDDIQIRVDFYPSNHPKYSSMISTAYPINVPANPF